jgi:hypothetical protein
MRKLASSLAVRMNSQATVRTRNLNTRVGKRMETSNERC